MKKLIPIPISDIDSHIWSRFPYLIQIPKSELRSKTRIKRPPKTACDALRGKTNFRIPRRQRKTTQFLLGVTSDFRPNDPGSIPKGNFFFFEAFWKKSSEKMSYLSDVLTPKWSKNTILHLIIIIIIHPRGLVPSKMKIGRRLGCILGVFWDFFPDFV